MTNTPTDYFPLVTITDAETFVFNSGVRDWEWGGNASADGFAQWLWKNRNEVDLNDYDEELRQYLTSVGETPSDYNL